MFRPDLTKDEKLTVEEQLRLIRVYIQDIRYGLDSFHHNEYHKTIEIMKIEDRIEKLEKALEKNVLL